MPELVDDLHRQRPGARIDDPRRAVVLDERAVVERRRARARPAPRRASVVAPFQRAARPAKTRCVGKIVSPGSLGGDEHDRHERARLRALLLVERDRRLVAVVAVRDQELPVRRRTPPGRPSSRHSLRALDLEVGLALRHRERRRRRRRGGRSARAARRSREAAAAGPPSGRGACARAAAPSPSRTARPAATRRGRCACARRRRGRRSPGRAPRRPARPRGRGRRAPASRARPARPRPRTPAASGGRRCAGCARAARPAAPRRATS